MLIGDIDEEGEGMSPLIKHLNFIQTISGIIVVCHREPEAVPGESEAGGSAQGARAGSPHADDAHPLTKPGFRLMITIRARGFYYPHYEVGGDYYDFMQLSEVCNRFLHC